MDFENNPAREARRQRLDAETDADNVGFVDPSGDERRWTGNNAAPYVAVLGRASATGDDDVPTGIPAVEDGEPQELLLDAYGRVWARVSGEVVVTEPTLVRVATGDTALAQTAPIAVPADEQMRLRWMGVAMAGGAGGGRVLMLFDSAAAVVNGAVPLWRAVMLDAGAGYFNSVDVEFETGGIILSSGLVLALSTTLNTLTLTGAVGLFQALYNLEPA